MVSAETEGLANQSKGAPDFPVAAETKQPEQLVLLLMHPWCLELAFIAFTTQLGNKEMLLCVLIIERWEVEGKEGFTSCY